MRALTVLATLVLTACGASLPEGWEGAEPFAVVQSDCTEGPEAEERVEHSIDAGVVSIQYIAAHFRCAQTVEAFVKTGDGTIDLLFQPEDLNPWGVASCDCRYNFDGKLTLKEAAAVSVWRRWDSASGVNTPKKIGEVSLKLN